MPDDSATPVATADGATADGASADGATDGRPTRRSSNGRSSNGRSSDGVSSNGRSVNGRSVGGRSSRDADADLPGVRWNGTDPSGSADPSDGADGAEHADDAAVTRRPRPMPRLPDGATVARRRPMPGPPVLRAAPEVAKVAAVSAWHLMSWSIGATVAGANYVARRAVEGQPATAILQEAATDLRNVAWRALGLPGQAAPVSETPAEPSARGASVLDLQRRGTDLLRRSNDVHVVEDTHPAFARILADITPDEARILRYLYLEGPQPAVDVRTYRPLGIGSELVAQGLSMVAEHAGLRNLNRIDLYLTNLGRLGMLEFSKEQVTNPSRYQVIEAQPKVAEALRRAGRMPRTVHRSIRLTPFGEEFVRTCLPLNGRTVPQPNERRSTPRGLDDA